MGLFTVNRLHDGVPGWLYESHFTACWPPCAINEIWWNCNFLSGSLRVVIQFFFVQIIHWWKFSSSLLERPHFNQRIARFKVLVHRQCTMQYVGHTPGITIRSTPALASHIVSSPSPEAKDRAQHQSWTHAHVVDAGSNLWGCPRITGRIVDPKS